MKYTVEQVKERLYSGVISDVLDGLGYRDQTIPNDIVPLTDDTVMSSSPRIWWRGPGAGLRDRPQGGYCP